MTDDAAAGWVAVIFVFLVVLGFFGGWLIFKPEGRTDCATLCVNKTCVETCPATTRSYPK